MGKVVKTVIGVVAIVGGAIYGTVTGDWANASKIMAAGYLMASNPRRELAQRTGHILENRAGGVERLPVVYGTTRIGALFADVRVDPASSRRKRLVAVAAFCHGSRDGSGVTAIDELWLDDKLALTGTVMAAPFNKVVSGGGGVRALEYEHHLGSTTQAADTRLTTLFPLEWAATAQGKGVCYSRLEFWYDTDVYPGGLPRIQAKIRGNKVYDPRDATWKHSSNPALCIRDYLCSTVYGVGVPEANIDEASFIDAANYCDETITVPDPTEILGFRLQKRFELNGWVDQQRPVEQNLAELCTSCRGQVINEGATWRMVIRRARGTYDFVIDKDNTIEGTWQFTLPGADTLPNTIRATYVDPSRSYDVDSVQWPEPGAANPYLDEDNGIENVMEVDLPYTQNRLMAQQIIMTLLKEMRRSVTVVVGLKESAIQTRVGDIAAVTAQTPGWDAKWFDIQALMLAPDATVQAVLTEYDDAIYNLDPQSFQPTVKQTNLPNPFDVPAPTSLVLTSVGQELLLNDGRYVPRIRATWAKSNFPFVDYYEIQAKKNTDTMWDVFGRVPDGSDALCFIYPVTDEQWDVRIRAVGTLGAASSWVSGSLLVVTPDPRPQVLSVTLTNAHVDISHTDVHTDVAHADAGHADTHSDTAHSDHTDHGDVHSDSAGHDDVAHGDTHSDIGLLDTDHTDTHNDTVHADHSDGHGDTHTDTNHQDASHVDTHGDIGALDTDHTDIHNDVAHGDHSDSGLSHFDTAHADTHSDTAHADSAHADGHTDSAHGDGQYGIGVAIQADNDAASVKAIARKHSDVAHIDHTDGAHSDTAHADITEPTDAEVRATSAVTGRNVVITLLDAATGNPIALAPGDRVRVGALAYSEAAGGGVEGPLALASVGLFTVAPVGTDLWVPS